jgi:hypothetical protein
MTTPNAEKMFDIDAMIDNMEKNVTGCTSYIWPETVREFTKTVTGTAFQFSRAQVSAMKDLGAGMRKAFQL